jgi:nicotinamidase-related amidase
MVAMTQALLIIDVQCGLFDPEPRPFEAEAVVARINALAGRARAAGVPVVYIQHERREGFLAHGSASWQLQAGLRPAPGDAMIRKTTPDSFLRTDLEALLTGWGVREVVICGYATEFCVDTSTRRAAALGLDVTLAADAHTTHDKPHATAEAIRAHHNATLADLTSFGPRIQALASAAIEFRLGAVEP